MKTILFLCTGNSARSILAEVIFNENFTKHGKAFSAGSKPTGTPNPYALKTLFKHGHSTQDLSSQNLTEFEDKDIDILVSVCDNAAQDCTTWQGKGQPRRVHWGLPDPADATGSDEKIMAVFEQTYQDVSTRIAALIKEI